MKLAICLLIVAQSCGAEAYDTDRRLGAVLGAAIADAAAMPLHWIYDTSSIDAKLTANGTRIDAAFYPLPSCPFYVYPEGENSPYGQQSRVILSTLANISSDPSWASQAKLQSSIQSSYWKYYGPDSGPCHEQQSMTHHEGCYWDGSTKGFIANYKAGLRVPNVGANDTQGNAIVHMVPLASALAGRVSESDMLSAIESAIRVTQNTEKAVAFGLAGARILSRVILGEPLLEAVRSVARVLQDPNRERPQADDMFLAKGLEKVLDELDRPNFDVVKMAFKLAVRQTIEAGGDSASRGNFIGALFGAMAGEAALPTAWKAKYSHYASVMGDAKKLLSHADPSILIL